MIPAWGAWGLQRERHKPSAENGKRVTSPEALQHAPG